MYHRRTRLLAVAGAVAVGVVALAGPASAHVTVNPNTAEQGSYTKLTFRVPTESDTASTTRVQVFFPADEPLALVEVKPHPGWSFTVTETKLAKPISDDDGPVTQAVSQISWTADSAAAAIKPGEFDEFDVSVGPLPEKLTIVFKALQTYSDGSIVRWIDPTVAGQPEPDHPAPVLTLTKAGSTASGVTATASGRSTTPAATSPSNARANTALVLAIIALVVALGAAAASLLRRSERSTEPVPR